ncbi:hypothetical protein HDU76_011315, partial [Blyttiomyces sp. JEL0837]
PSPVADSFFPMSPLLTTALDKAGNTPLHWACRGGHAEIVQMILTKSPAVNAQNKLGDTPLHLAAWGGNVKTVSLLLEAPGIQTGLKNKDGATPQSLAKGDDVAALLMQFTGSGYSNNLGGDEDEDDD